MSEGSRLVCCRFFLNICVINLFLLLPPPVRLPFIFGYKLLIYVPVCVRTSTPFMGLYTVLFLDLLSPPRQ